MTDWSTIVEPQEDGSDTDEINGFVTNICSESGVYCEPYEGEVTGLTILNGDVRILDFVPTLEGVVPLAIDSGFAQEVERLLTAWPTYARQLDELFLAIYPVIQKGSSPKTTMTGGSYGTRKNDVARHFGQVYGTADTAHGLAEAIVSGVANWKMYAMGIKTKEWDSDLILNAKEELVKAQVRPGNEMVPLGAVLNAQYAILHILEWNLYLARSGEFSDWERWYLSGIKLHSAKVSRGIDTLKQVPQVTEAGAIFMARICSWSSRLVEESSKWF